MPNRSQSPVARSARLGIEGLEDRTTPTFLPRVGAQQLFVNNATVPSIGLSIAAGDLLPDPLFSGAFVQNEYVTGTGPGVEGTVRVWRQNGTVNGQGVPALSFVPFPGFLGGINVAVGDVTGDGTSEIIAAVATSGPPHVKVFDNLGRELSSFYAFDPTFTGGVNVAVGNVLGGIGAGGFPGGTTSTRFKQEIIAGAASGGSPHVVVASVGDTGASQIVRSFLAFDLGYRGGVTVAAGSIDATQSDTFSTTGIDTNAYDEIIVGSASGSAHVKAFAVDTGEIVERLSYFAFDPSTSQGVTVAAGSTDGNRGAEIYVARIIPPALTPAMSSAVRVFNGSGLFQLEFFPYPAGYTQLVNMVVSNLSGYYDPSDEDSFFFGNPEFQSQDFAVVAGDGSQFQQPRFYNSGFLGTPAGAFGP